MSLGSVASYILAIFIGFFMGAASALGYVIWQSAQISRESSRVSQELNHTLKHIMKPTKRLPRKKDDTHDTSKPD